MQRWWHAEVFGDETKKNAESVKCCWEYSEILGLQDGRVEVDPNPVAPARHLPVVNLEIPAEPNATRTRNEENGRRICITKKMASEFGATLGCRCCISQRNVEPGLPHGWRTILHTRSGSKTIKTGETNSLIRKRRLLCPVREEHQAATKTWCVDWTYVTSLTSLTETVFSDTFAHIKAAAQHQQQ